MTSDDYIHKYDKLESKSATFVCRICSKDMKRNLFAINQHMELEHGMGALEYGDEDELERHSITYQQFEELKKAQRKTISCSESPESVPTTHIPLKAIGWQYGSEYQCRICSQMFYEPRKLSTHLKDQHSVKLADYEKKYGDLLTKSHKYTCQICDSYVEHTLEAIAG